MTLPYDFDLVGVRRGCSCVSAACFSQAPAVPPPLRTLGQSRVEAGEAIFPEGPWGS